MPRVVENERRSWQVSEIAVQPSVFGVTWYVDSGSGASTNVGRNPLAPFATIAQALSAATASRGDIIVVGAGHVETISAAAGIDFNVAGVKIVGMGEAQERPTITLDTLTTTTVVVSAANVTIENIIFTANFADIASCFDVNADDFTIRNCRFQATATDMNFLICILAGTANQSDRLRVYNCNALAIDAANTIFISFPAAEDECEVIGCRLIGDWGTAAISAVGVITFCIITDNVIYNAASTSDAIINLAATATGIVMRNYGAGAAVQANGITATACAIAENYYGVLSEDLSAILDPIAT